MPPLVENLFAPNLGHLYKNISAMKYCCQGTVVVEMCSCTCNTELSGGANWMGNANVDCVGTVGRQGGRASGTLAGFSPPPVR